MTNSLPLPPPGFDDLPVEDQIDYVQSLWDRVAAKPDQVPVPEWHKQVLDERVAAHETNPEAARPWEEVRDGNPFDTWSKSHVTSITSPGNPPLLWYRTGEGEI